MSNTVKVESYNQGKSITLTVEEGQEYFLFCLFDSNKKIVGNPFESQIVSNVGSHEVIELASKLPDVTEPDTYKLYVSAKHKDKTIGEPVTLPWKEVGTKDMKTNPNSNPAPADEPANNTGGTPPAVSAAQAAVAAPSPSDPDTDKVKEIQTRLGNIERHLDMSIKRMENVKNPSKGYLLMVDDMLRRMRGGMRDISTIVASIETSRPDECTGFKDQMTLISANMERLEDMCRGFKSVAAASTKAPVSNPDPAPAASDMDPDPINNRIDGLEKEMAYLKLQLADKASSKDLTNLSGSVNGLDKRVTGLKGQVTGLQTTIEGVGKEHNNRLDKLMAAVDELASKVQASSASSATSASATTTDPAVQDHVPATVPTQVTAANPVSKGKRKSGRESVNFFALVLGIAMVVLALIAMFFYATRSQSIDAERIGASDAKSAAVAEMENAKRLQMETTEAVNNLRQQVEGYKRQTLVMPPPSLSSTVTNTIVMTNTIVVTNTLAPSSNTNGAVTNTFGKLSYHLDRPIEGISLGDTFEMQPCIEAYWFPSWTQNLYGYRKARGFNGYLEPR